MSRTKINDSGTSRRLRSAALAVVLAVAAFLGVSSAAAAAEPARTARGPEVVSGLVLNKAYITPGLSVFGWNPGGVCWGLVVLGSGGWTRSSTWCVDEDVWHRTALFSHFDGAVVRRVTEWTGGR